jgi:phosphate transport system permease protein
MVSPASLESSASMKNLAQIRAMIKRHKMNDTMFAVLGLLALMLGLITLLVLFTDLILDGSGRVYI